MNETESTNSLFDRTEELIKNAKIKSRIKQERDEIEIEKLQNKLEAQKGWIRCSENDIKIFENRRKKYFSEFVQNGDIDDSHRQYLDKELREARSSLQKNKSFQCKSSYRKLKLHLDNYKYSQSKLEKITNDLQPRSESRSPISRNRREFQTPYRGNGFRRPHEVSHSIFEDFILIQGSEQRKYPRYLG